jgi:hypothetical protein
MTEDVLFGAFHPILSKVFLFGVTRLGLQAIWSSMEPYRSRVLDDFQGSIHLLYGGECILNWIVQGGDARWRLNRWSRWESPWEILLYEWPDQYNIKILLLQMFSLSKALHLIERTSRQPLFRRHFEIDGANGYESCVDGRV